MVVGSIRDRLYWTLVNYVEELSEHLNKVCRIRPKIFLRINQDDLIGGSTALSRRSMSTYIELDVPHDYVLNRKNKIEITCMLIHEYCHYLDAIKMTKEERAENIDGYTSNLKAKRADEQRTWRATKRLAKLLGLWNKSFYKAARKCQYTAALQF